MRNDVKGFIPVTKKDLGSVMYISIENICYMAPSEGKNPSFAVVGTAGGIFLEIQETVEEVLSLIQANNQMNDPLTVDIE